MDLLKKRMMALFCNHDDIDNLAVWDKFGDLIRKQTPTVYLQINKESYSLTWFI